MKTILDFAVFITATEEFYLLRHNAAEFGESQPMFRSNIMLLFSTSILLLASC
jgi:hypothetical protein